MNCKNCLSSSCYIINIDQSISNLLKGWYLYLSFIEPQKLNLFLGFLICSYKTLENKRFLINFKFNKKV